MKIHMIGIDHLDLLCSKRLNYPRQNFLPGQNYQLKLASHPQMQGTIEKKLHRTKFVYNENKLNARNSIFSSFNIITCRV